MRLSVDTPMKESLLFRPLSPPSFPQSYCANMCCLSDKSQRLLLFQIIDRLSYGKGLP